MESWEFLGDLTDFLAKKIVHTLIYLENLNNEIRRNNATFEKIFMQHFCLKHEKLHCEWQLSLYIVRKPNVFRNLKG